MSAEIHLQNGNTVSSSLVNTAEEAPPVPTDSMGLSMLHTNLHKFPRKIVRASGNYLELDTGQKIFDGTAGAAVAALGHGNKRVQDAAIRQMEKFSYCQTPWFASDAGEDLAKFLIGTTQGHMSKVFIVNSGSEANEAAFKMARQYFLEKPNPEPQRVKFIARHQSYHGMTLGALSMSGMIGRRAHFEPILLNNISRVSPCNAYRGLKSGETIDDFVQRLAQELDEEFERVGPDTVIAFIAEPVVGSALGAVPAVPGYLQAMKQVCHKHGALFILDEVMSGMGRTGTLHAWEQDNAPPDIQTIGKGLGAGYAPVAGMLLSHRVVNGLDHGSGAFVHAQTYQGQPLVCAVALEVQKIVQEQELLSNVRKMGKMLEASLRKRLNDHPHVGDIRGRGLFLGIEFVQDKPSKTPFELKHGISMKIHEKALGPPYSIALFPATGSADGKQGDHMIIAPPYTITEQDVELISRNTASVIEDFFTDFQRSD